MQLIEGLTFIHQLYVRASALLVRAVDGNIIIKHVGLD